MLPTWLGSAVYQINLLAMTLFASLQAEGSLSCLYFADRLIQFPLGLFGVAAATAALPSLSRLVAAKDMASFEATLSHLLRLVMFVTLPSMAGLMVLRGPIVSLLFERGAFDAAAARLTSAVLLYYCLGMWAFAAARVTVQTFYALQDTRTPVITGSVCVGANLLFMAVLAGPMGPRGLALAVSLSSALNVALLLWALKRRSGRLGGTLLLWSVGKSAFCSLVMAAGVEAAARGIGLAQARNAGELLWRLAVAVIVGVGMYAAASILVKSPEVSALLALARNRHPAASRRGSGSDERPK